jgi:hypothetical protein
MAEKITPVEEWQDAVRDHIKKLDENEKRHFAHVIIFDTALWVGYNTYEMIGILECVKLDLLNTLNNADEEDDDEEDD